MRRNRLSIMGVSEVRSRDGGDFVSDGYRVMYAGGPTYQRGVAVIAEAKVAERVTEIDRFADRIMVVKVKAEPVDMVTVQAYMPTTDYEDWRSKTILSARGNIRQTQRNRQRH